MDKNEISEQLLSLKDMLTTLENFKSKIICTGLLNAGKSTLLNALIGDLNNSVFATADIRETTENKSYSINNLTYIDTPGLDANNEDTKKVYSVIQNADIILFVHNIKTGEFDPSEIEFFTNLQRNFKDIKSFFKTFIFVLTRKDELPEHREELEIQEVKNKIQQQLIDIFGESSEYIIAVSATVYQESLKNNENLLLQYSNLAMLKQAIGTFTTHHTDTILKQRLYRIDTIFKNIKNDILRKREELVFEKEKLLLDNEKSILSFKQDIKKLNSILKQKEIICKGL